MKCKLIETEESMLLQWIFSMNKCGAPLRPTTVQEKTLQKIIRLYQD